MNTTYEEIERKREISEERRNLRREQSTIEEKLNRLDTIEPEYPSIPALCNMIYDLNKRLEVLESKPECNPWSGTMTLPYQGTNVEGPLGTPVYANTDEVLKTAAKVAERNKDLLERLA